MVGKLMLTMVNRHPLSNSIVSVRYSNGMEYNINARMGLSDILKNMTGGLYYLLLIKLFDLSTHCLKKIYK